MLISLVLAGAVMASLAVGVLTAYGVCVGFFRVMQMQAAREKRGRAAVGLVTEG